MAENWPNQSWNNQVFFKDFPYNQSFILQHIQFATRAFCNTCNVQHLQFATLAIGAALAYIGEKSHGISPSRGIWPHPYPPRELLSISWDFGESFSPFLHILWDPMRWGEMRRNSRQSETPTRWREVLLGGRGVVKSHEETKSREISRQYMPMLLLLAKWAGKWHNIDRNFICTINLAKKS